jgi:drug/metabolite transporter (DMT)-like permease
MAEFRDNLRGILAMLACCLFFILNDTCVKAVGDTLPLGQVIVLRGILTTVAIVAMAWWTGVLGQVPRLFVDRLVGLRTVGEVGATVLYLSALLTMPIANISAIAQAAPLMITAAGALFLGERVGWRRWTAVGIGFIGILIIVRPGAEGFNVWALVALGSVMLVTVRDVTTRLIPAGTPVFAITTVASVWIMVAGGGLTLVAGEVWQPLGGREILLVAGSAAFLLAGMITVIAAMRHGDIAVVAPFRYAFIPYAILIGWLVWGDVPDRVTLFGILVVVATGVYTFYRERKVAARLTR